MNLIELLTNWSYPFVWTTWYDLSQEWRSHRERLPYTMPQFRDSVLHVIETTRAEWLKMTGELGVIQVTIERDYPHLLELFPIIEPNKTPDALAFSKAMQTIKGRVLSERKIAPSDPPEGVVPIVVEIPGCSLVYFSSLVVGCLPCLSPLLQGP